jgi:hypothetical protein
MEIINWIFCKKRVKPCIIKPCKITSEMTIVNTPITKRRKLNAKFGCQICKYIVLSKKNSCAHKFCDFCIETKIEPIDALNDCAKCVELIAQAVSQNVLLIGSHPI